MNKELRTLLFEMRKKHLTAEANEIEKIVGVQIPTLFSQHNTEILCEYGNITAGEKKEYYQDIIYLDKEESFEGFEGGSEGFFDAEENDQFNFLMQWESSEGEILDHKIWGTGDDLKEIERSDQIYYMYLYSGLGTAGLVRLVHEDEYSDFDITPEEED